MRQQQQQQIVLPSVVVVFLLLLSSLPKADHWPSRLTQAPRRIGCRAGCRRFPKSCAKAEWALRRQREWEKERGEEREGELSEHWLLNQIASEAPGSVLHSADTDTDTFTPTDTATISVIHICEHAKCNYKSRQMWINFCFESQPATGSGSRGVWVTCVYAICLDEAKLIELTFGNARNHANL